MSVLETTLVFVLIPLAVASLLALLTLGAGGSRTARYRPGMPFEFTPVWFLAAPPPSAGPLLDGGHAALEHASAPSALAAGSTRTAGSASTVAEDGAYVTDSGPKGGARGTW